MDAQGVGRSSRRALIAGVVAVVLVAACSSGGAARPEATEAGAHRRLVAAIDADLDAHPVIPGEAVSIRGPGLEVEAARGYADVAAKVPLRVDTPFRIASVTKTFVAVSVLRLVEQDEVDLDAPIAQYLSPATTAQLTSGGYAPDRITVRQLLAHTSGLFDYATSEDYDHANTSDPGRHWTAAEQIAFAMEHGHPLAEPGAGYRYADTNYVLLGEIVERATGEPLAPAVRRLVGFDRLGLDDTSWEQLEPAPAGQPARAHQYFGTAFDNAVLDASSDLYGGGGLVSTVGDLTRFYRALFDGRILSDDASLDAMLTISKPGRQEGAGLGIFAKRFAGVQCFGHPGYWGTEAYYCPRLRTAFALATNQADEAVLDTTGVERTILAIARAAAPVS